MSRSTPRGTDLPYLPIEDVLPRLVAELREAGNVVLQAPTGAGKTTRVPPALLDAGLAGDKQIVMLEPRRLAARAAARRMAQERRQDVGGQIGFHVRFERRSSRDTQVLVVTEGLLLRMLHDDPYLESVGVVVFDEFHERNLDNDLALGMVRLLQTTVRPDLRIVVMSATLATAEVAKYLGNCPTVVSEGRLFPVDIAYEPRAGHQPWPVAVAEAVGRMLERTPGDLLVFLPGVAEIRQTSHQLATVARQMDVAVVPLYGDLPAEQQDVALLRGPRRRVVLATNVAETSVTVEGVTGVVDTGLARVLRFDPHVGLDRLELTHIARSSADQRAGRAGRVAPGLCVRLWSPSHQLARAEQSEPEVRRVDLAGAVLQLLSLGERDVESFPWFESPKPLALQHARELLERLGAVSGGELTPLGRTLARLPVHPRIGRLLVEGARAGCAERAATAAALLAERDLFTRPTSAGPRHVPIPRAATRSDLLERVEAWEEYERTGRTDFSIGHLSKGSARAVEQARRQLLRSLETAAQREPFLESFMNRAAGAGPNSNANSEAAFLRAVLAAYPDRVAKRRERNSLRGVMVGGRGVRLDPASGVTESELFVCVAVDAGQGETLVRQASAIEREWLPADQMHTSIEVEFDETARRMSARRRVRFADLLLDESPAALPGGEQLTQALASIAGERLSEVLPAADSDGGRFLARVRSLRQWMPELELPEFSDDELRTVLPWLCAGCRSLEEVRLANWLAALGTLLTPTQRQAVEREAPERLAVPSGSRIALQYEPGRVPVLAVRIQEVFGWRDTPRIAGGRVRVLLHLLGPNYRPQQVTDDLASFWANGYPIIRKELKRRYPKHAWPEDPWSAQAEHRPQRKSN